MSQATTEEALARVRVQITGVVQGVGFRPYVFTLATGLGLAGYVRNDGHGVVAEIEGPRLAIQEFLTSLRSDAPPLAAIEDMAAEELARRGETGFEILESEGGPDLTAPVSPDVATCDACLEELFDPANRRYRYPFINCTHCGPRFTIVQGIPYDRARTTMASFVMCAGCRAEYEDPRDRRFHAQPNACPTCGPRARLVDAAGRELPRRDGEDAIAAAAACLRDGQVLAVKGVGGVHLACRADHEPAVAALRSRKHREDKPFALMAPDVARVRQLVELGRSDEALLGCRERPIVLARRHSSANVAASVAPGSSDLGVMLPYSPLHHLLLADSGTTLVMTSGNVSDEPIAYRDDEALQRLALVADAFLVHDRPIHMRTDDSVVRSVAAGRGSILLRRSRGYVPRELELTVESPPALGCGAELKSTFCLARGRRAWVGHHIGDLSNYETLSSFRDGIGHFERLFGIEPRLVAHDLHPDYLSTRFALELEGRELVGVQHHHAHLAACLAEHGERGPAVAAIYDGSGYGPDGTVWGGELLAGDTARSKRAGHLLPVSLPGGDAAVRQPWRMACSWIARVSGEDVPPQPRTLAEAVDPATWRAVARMARTGEGSPLTSSVGRLFDAVSALCGIRAAVNYEGQAAAELEGISDPGEHGAYPLPVSDGAEVDAGLAGVTVLDARHMIAAVLDDVIRLEPPHRIGARFHAALAAATASGLQLAAERFATDIAVLSGGAFQNRILLEATERRLRAAGLRVLVPERLPPNDGGIAFGQVAAAAARIGIAAGA